MASLDDSKDPLAEYKARRDFGKTPEPEAKRGRSKGNSFVIQKHAATRTHFDFRLELDGVLKSWAVTKGPSFDTHQKRLAVRTEDHPLQYGKFEGVIPKGEYGGGPVMLWDRGTWEPIGDPHKGLAKGHLDFRLDGERLKGEWHLVRMKSDRRGGKRENWLLIKASDEYAKPGDEPTEDFDTSVESGRSMDEILNGESAIWTSKPKETKGSKKKPEAKRWYGKRPPPSEKAREPDFIAPELATLVDRVPEGDGWLHEIKFDGYRIEARKAGEQIFLYSRSGLDWTVRFPGIAEALAKLPCKSCLIDGEAAYVLPSGLTDFKSLQEHIDSDDPAIRYYAFDLLELDGKDLRRLPLKERKETLKTLLTKKALSDRVNYSDHIAGNGESFFREACQSGLEGIVSKRANAPYSSGRSKAWLKIKCGHEAEFVIGGFSKSEAKGRPFASLLLGTFEEGRLIFAGKVGTGFNMADMKALAAKFAPLTRKTSPFEEVPAAERRDAVWLRPELVCEVAFTEWTRDGRLRHPSFQGLREDKPAGEVFRDEPPKEASPMAKKIATAPAKTVHEKTGAAPRFDGITLTHPERVLYPELGLTKLGLAEYYEQVADVMLPYLLNRPISLVRCPEGAEEECFFQRHAMRGMSDKVKEIAIPGGSTKQKYLYVEDKAGLFALVQIGVLEIHDWGVSLKDLTKPDRIVFDLDPDEGLELETLKAACVEVRQFLDDLGLKSFLKSTGGKGFHVVAPITARTGWDEVKAFCKGVADALVTARGDRYTSNLSKKARGGKIFVDYLRNQRGSSAIVNYSTRARTGAPVACPLRWDELEGLKKASPYSTETVVERIAALKGDPWEGFFKTRQSITKKAMSALGLG